MKTSTDNKMVSPEKETKVENKQQKFFYPDHQVTVEAESKEEADKKLEKIQEVE